MERDGVAQVEREREGGRVVACADRRAGQSEGVRAVRFDASCAFPVAGVGDAVVLRRVGAQDAEGEEQAAFRHDGVAQCGEVRAQLVAQVTGLHVASSDVYDGDAPFPGSQQGVQLLVEGVERLVSAGKLQCVFLIPDERVGGQGTEHGLPFPLCGFRPHEAGGQQDECREACGNEVVFLHHFISNRLNVREVCPFLPPPRPCCPRSASAGPFPYGNGRTCDRTPRSRRGCCPRGARPSA